MVISATPITKAVAEPELAILMGCAGIRDPKERKEELRALLHSPVDFAQLTWLAERHGLMPLLYYHLSQVEDHGIGDEDFQQLRLRFEENARVNLQFTGWLLRVMEDLSQHGIRVLPYKGPALAMSLYQNVALRQMSDLDVLVGKESVAAAAEILKQSGFTSIYSLSRRQYAEHLKAECEYEFLSPDTRFYLDLHWQIVPRHVCIDFDFEKWWARRQMLKVGGTEIPVMSAEDTLLVLAVHGAKHMWERMSWLAEFAEATQVPLDWDYLHAEAKRMRIERVLYFGLALAWELMQAPLRTDVMIAIKADPVIPSLTQLVRNNIALASGGAGGDFSRSITLLRLRQRWQDRARMLWRYVFTSGVREWESARIPDGLFPLYRVLRAGRLCSTVLAGLWRRA